MLIVYSSGVTTNSPPACKGYKTVIARVPLPAIELHKSLIESTAIPAYNYVMKKLNGLVQGPPDPRERPLHCRVCRAVVTPLNYRSV